MYSLTGPRLFILPLLLCYRKVGCISPHGIERLSYLVADNHSLTNTCYIWRILLLDISTITDTCSFKHVRRIISRHQEKAKQWKMNWKRIIEFGAVGVLGSTNSNNFLITFTNTYTLAIYNHVLFKTFTLIQHIWGTQYFIY